jgi:hypothetical protein
MTAFPDHTTSSLRSRWPLHGWRRVARNGGMVGH